MPDGMKIRLLMGRREAKKLSGIAGVDEFDGSEIAPESVVVVCADEAAGAVETLRQISLVLKAKTLSFLVDREKMISCKGRRLIDHSSSPLPQSSEYVATISVGPEDLEVHALIEAITNQGSATGYSPETAFESTIANFHMPSVAPNTEEDKSTEGGETPPEERPPLGEVNSQCLNTKNEIVSRSFYVNKWEVGKIIGHNGNRISFIRQHTHTNVKVKTRKTGPKVNINVTGYPKQVEAAIELISQYLSTD